MSRRTLLILGAAAVLAGCTPTAARQVPPPTGDGTRKLAPPRECSRQFDENEAGFQTCLDRLPEAPASP
jgi:Prokaryotic membrane lipoprotein lipid attachment site